MSHTIRNTLVLLAVTALAVPVGSAREIFSADFSKGDFNSFGWEVRGGWDIFDYHAATNNPGPVARFAARQPEGQLRKTFPVVKEPETLTLSLDVGWGWGEAGQGADTISFMLLDDQECGYVFQVTRAKANWAVQWGLVEDGVIPKDKHWASSTIDGRHVAVRDGGGLQRLVVTRVVGGNWTIAGKSWNQGAGGSVGFNDRTVKTFSRLVLLGTQNFDEQDFNHIVLETAPPPAGAAEAAAKLPNEEYPDFYAGEDTKGIDFVQAIAVTSPAYGSEIKGDVTVMFQAPHMTQAKALCWQQSTEENPDSRGHDVEVAPDIVLDKEGHGTFVFHADQFPNGPITIRILAKNNRKKQDLCELQLFNRGGVVWNQGIPREASKITGLLWWKHQEEGAPVDPPAAKGMKLAFADDFDGPLSISPDGRNARYPAHKTGGGDFSGWLFSDPQGENQPFGQQGTFLRIHASKKPETKGCTGILSSMRSDGSGVTATVPCYFECRFIAQSAPGTWPAFWTLTKGAIGLNKGTPAYEEISKLGCEELDIIEAYGGYGPGNPNSGGRYSITTHYWKMPKPAWTTEKGPDGKPNPLYRPTHSVVDTLTLGAKSSWSWTFHTYGLLISETDTVYYFDNIEVLRHPTGPLSKRLPTWFLINYAIGGISGWKIDLERYGNQSDMWVDFVRVYQGAGRTQQ